ncbi:hypothetical protein V6N13_098044 [Hibiscus sabdariffa]|uniref:Uncharacterized protein n=1 Tax=Hibiscus sabdariffa TaxID=183260 RepID=A0ABR2ABQ2_9ROSI
MREDIRDFVNREDQREKTLLLVIRFILRISYRFFEVKAFWGEDCNPCQLTYSISRYFTRQGAHKMPFGA